MANDRTEFLATARKRFKEAAADEKPLRDEAAKNLRFVAGEQWEPQLKANRENAGRPALTFNRCHTFVAQVANEARQNKPAIKYVPAEDGDKDTAEVYEGLARHIQQSSDAQVAFETSLEYSAGGGFGVFGFVTDYVEDESWDQELKVREFPDPFAVYGVLIPSIFRIEPRYAFVVQETPLDEYRALYPDSEATKINFEDAEKRSEGWIGTETVRVAEYWYVEEKPREIVNPQDATKKRTVYDKTVHCAKINGLEVLEEYEWPGSSIPIVAVLGKQLIVEGKPKLQSVIGPQRDAQQLINLYKSRIAETIGIAPISPFLAVEGQMEGHEGEWARMNAKLTPYLYYKSVSVNGQPAGPPQRQVYEPPIQAISAAVQQEVEDMKATSGIFDASLGAQANETSGVAIQRRQQQSNTANLHYMDNLERAFQKGGRIMSELIPKIYDTPRIIRILGADETPKLVKINQLHEAGGRQVHYKIGGDAVGKYDVIVTMARSYSSKRMESFDLYAQLGQHNPQMALLTSDLMLRNSDMAGADEGAERMKRFLSAQYPGLIEDKNQAQVPPQVQAQVTQMQNVLQQQNALIQQQHKVIEQKQIEQQGKMDIERLRIEASITIAEINAKAQEASTRLKLEQDMWRELHGSAHDAAMQVQGHQQAQEMSALGHEQGMESAEHGAQLAQQQAEQQPEQSSAS